MSLDDRLFPEDGTLLTRFDNWMIKNTRIIGEMYQSSGRSYKELARKSADVGYTLEKFLTFGFAIKEKMVFESPLEEETRMESLYLTKTQGKSDRLGGIIRTLGIAGVGAFCLYFWNRLHAPIMQEFNLQDREMAHLIGMYALGAYSSVLALSESMEAFGQYLSKASLPPPKTKHQEKPYPILLGPIEDKQ